ncbi:MAG: GWxTD domain-containing protein, partial [bacterium]
MNRNAEAVKKLHRLLTQKPSYIDEENGSAWYLFGQAVLTMDGKERAFRIWLRGLQRLKKEDLVDPFLNHAFVRLAIQLDKEKHYNLITEAFYDLLARADVQRHRAMLERIHKQCEFFLPEGRQRHMERMLNKPGLNVHPGRMLLEYWRRSDLTPATLVNERLIEHLQRVEYAGQHYASDHVRGFDDRGKIYVRLGKPNRIAYAPHDILLVDNRPHEKWYYDSIARGLNFVFVDFEKGRGFERVVLDFQSEDFHQKVTPKVATDALSRVGLLPIQVRTARFQESNGATRLELYFGLRKKDLMVKSLEPLLPTDTLRVKLVTTIENSSSWPTSTDRQTVAEFTGNDRLEDDMLVFWLATTTHQDSFYVSGQVETWFSSFGTEFTQEANASLQNAWQNSHSHSEKLFKLSAFRTELNKALRAEGAPLLMSDLQLAHQVLVDPEHPTRNKGNLKVEPYPFQRVFRNQLLFLYFEI